MRIEYDGALDGAVWAGIDTHAATNWLSVVDSKGSELFSGPVQTGRVIEALSAGKLGEFDHAAGWRGNASALYGAATALAIAARGMPLLHEVVTRAGRLGRDEKRRCWRHVEAARQVLAARAIPKIARRVGRGGQARSRREGRPPSDSGIFVRQPGPFPHGQKQPD